MVVNKDITAIKNKKIQKKIRKMTKRVNPKSNRSESTITLAIRRFRKNRTGMFGLAVVILMFFIAIFVTPFTITLSLDNNVSSFYWGGLTTYDPELHFDNTGTLIIYNGTNPDNLSVGALYSPPYQPPGEYHGYIVDTGNYTFNNVTQTWGYSYQNITIYNFLGTNAYGQDIYSRILLGTRVTLIVSIGAVLLSMFIALPLGLVAGFYGGKIDELLMRFTDIFLTLPGLLIILLSVDVFSSNIALSNQLDALKLTDEFFVAAVIFGLGAFGWQSTARLVRAQIFQIKSMDYVEAAKALGASSNRIMIRHILPNILVPLMVVISFTLGINIVLEAAISFLLFSGTTYVSWGVEIANGLRYFTTAWWGVIFPAIVITFAVLAFNLLGDGISDAFDPKQR